VALVPNLVLSVILIPDHGAIGAAVAAVAGAAVLVTIVVARTAGLFGRINLGRVLAAPMAAGAAMAACAVALSGAPWLVAALASAAAYCGAFLVLGRGLFRAIKLR